MNRKCAFVVLLMFSFVLCVSSCSRGHEVEYSRESAMKMEKLIGAEFTIRKMKLLSHADFHETLTNAFAKARVRFWRKDNYQFIPLYMKLSVQNDSASNTCASFSFWGYGTKNAWQDESHMWIILAKQDENGKCVEIVETSFENISYGGAMSWDDRLQCGWSIYRCMDPFLGFPLMMRENWFQQIIEGKIIFYCFLDNAHEHGERIGRKFISNEKWEKKLRSLEDVGLITKLECVSYDSQNCWMKCR